MQIYSLLILFYLSLVVCNAGAAIRPNILLIMADDLGYADLSIHGNQDFSTPHLDDLAESGIRFTDAYVTAPVCGPSRAGLITGRNQERFGFEGHPGPKDTWGLPLEEITLPAMLDAAGYHTALFGKWHLGSEPGYRPLDRGFDEFFGFLSGMHDYFRAKDTFWGDLVEGDAKPVSLNQYLTFELADRTSDFIMRQAGNTAPFFAWLSFNAPHTPLQAPKRYLNKTNHLSGDRRPVYAAMVMAMDDAIGAVLQALAASAQLDNTIVVFVSDNGGALIPGSSRNGASNSPLRGSKAELWEGGVRVPLFISWPGRIEPNQVSSEIVSTLDFFPTFAALAGGQVPLTLEGVSLADLLLGEQDTLSIRQLFWRFYGTQKAVRFGALKWTQVANQTGLYDLVGDSTETLDLSERQPEQLQELKSQWRQWHRSNQKTPLSALSN
ncbi:sulfatase-like hydrolase/transferase [Coraliomargarita sp. SDUM461004]|uniref:Sulfatase-like hydrolase/transferase n=1 Tax=Thalassobacterium sedimentorum TaxID=3041258 RepID=A0ABU1AG30_9BACT|nr:sulfatase-like hydrolase/transferase [Coraliomargarita sp. SDUM461004]MDQ8193679.1 sulfatase-like hydrolase/transferase [Coraliomargarita sp. SDUM461004]